MIGSNGLPIRFQQPQKYIVKMTSPPGQKFFFLCGCGIDHFCSFTPGPQNRISRTGIKELVYFVSIAKRQTLMQKRVTTRLRIKMRSTREMDDIFCSLYTES